jgi:predicted nucleic acid-binding protein
MRLFLDTNVLLSACGSANGASSQIIELAALNRWHLVVTPYVISEVQKNLPQLSPAALLEWPAIQAHLLVMQDVYSIHLPTVFSVPKDRPVLFGALAWADVLLTLDKNDFQDLLGASFYRLAILKPGEFLKHERDAGRLNMP